MKPDSEILILGCITKLYLSQELRCVSEISVLNLLYIILFHKIQRIWENRPRVLGEDLFLVVLANFQMYGILERGDHTIRLPGET